MEQASRKTNPTAHPAISPRVPHFAIGTRMGVVGCGDSFSFSQRSTTF
jgi:hypothetical protein